MVADVTPGGRAAVIRVVGRQGPLTAAAAAALLGVTPAAVRRHLDSLVDSGLVAPHQAAIHGARGRGRPARAFVLTTAGRAELHTDDRSAAGGPEDLAAAALDFIARTHGEQAVARFAHQRAKEMEARFAPRLALAGPDLGQRIAALADALDEEGYAATARPVVSGVQLCQGGCPVQRIAAEHPQLCEAETEAFAPTPRQPRAAAVHPGRWRARLHDAHRDPPARAARSAGARRPQDPPRSGAHRGPGPRSPNERIPNERIPSLRNPEHRNPDHRNPNH